MQCQPQPNRESQLFWGQEYLVSTRWSYPSRFCLDWQEIKIANPEKELVFCSAQKRKVANGETYYFRAVARSENPGGHIVLCGDDVFPLVEIGLTGLPKTGEAQPVPLGTGPYLVCDHWFTKY